MTNRKKTAETGLAEGAESRMPDFDAKMEAPASAADIPGGAQIMRSGTPPVFHYEITAHDALFMAKERFAALMALLQKQGNVVAMDELNAIGTLLGLHSSASALAQATGDYRVSSVNA